MTHGTNHVMDIIAPDGDAWLTIAVGFIAYFLVSFLWWGPIFGKKWAAEMGMPMEKQDGKTIGMALVWTVLGTFLIAYVLWHVMSAMMMTTNPAGEFMRGELDWTSGMAGGFYTWLGFFVPLQLSRVSWEKASWTLFAINVAGHLVALLAMSAAFVVLGG